MNCLTCCEDKSLVFDNGIGSISTGYCLDINQLDPESPPVEGYKGEFLLSLSSVTAMQY